MLHHHSPESRCCATPSRGKDCANKTITPPITCSGLRRCEKGVRRVSVEKLPERRSRCAGTANPPRPWRDYLWLFVG
jgi:hypothetical protein